MALVHVSRLSDPALDVRAEEICPACKKILHIKPLALRHFIMKLTVSCSAMFSVSI